MPHMLTIGYLTSRKNPMIEFFLRSLRREIHGDVNGIQLIVVDFHMNDDPDDISRRDWLKNLIKEEGLEGIELVHVAPKPTVWQGRHRKTKNHHFAPCNARNTIFALAKHDYVACVDDLSALVPGWLDNVLHGKVHGYVSLGAYRKVFELNVDKEGHITYRENPSGIDSRWGRGSATGIVAAEGSWLFGCSFALPLEAALKINGFDERCDGTGLEDVEFGCRLERAGMKIFYNRNVGTVESEEGHGWEGNQKFIRESKPTKYGMNSDWYILNRLIRGNKTWTEGNDFNLRELRNKVLSGEAFPIPEQPTLDWRNDQPLSEI